MPDSPPPRRYDEDEVRRILERATELQRDLPGPTGSDGVTLAELEEIATEAGIDRTLIRRAAREMDVGAEEAGGWATVAGASPKILLERTLPGEIPDEAFEILATEIQRFVGSHGQPAVLGRTLSWRSETPASTRLLHVMVTSRDGETHIRIAERLHQLAGGLFGGIVGGFGGGVGLGVGLGVGIGALGSALFAVGWPLGIVGLSYMTAREIFRGMVRNRRRALSDLLERLTEVVLDETRRRLESPEGPPASADRG